MFEVNMLNKIIVLCFFALCSGEDDRGKVFDLAEASHKIYRIDFVQILQRYYMSGQAKEQIKEVRKEIVPGCIRTPVAACLQLFNSTTRSNCSWSGLEGNCTNINNCQSAKDALRWNIHPPICSFQEMTPIVCCTICTPNHSTTDRVKDFGEDSRYNRTRKARDNCLNYLKTLDYPCSFPPGIPFGERSLSEKTCYDSVEPSALENTDNHSQGDLVIKPKRSAENQALLGYGDNLEIAEWLCGGSVISEKYILTAAHCISSPAVGPVKFIALGILKRSDSPEYWQTHNVTRILAHPEYRPPSKYNDIALLETEHTISFTINVLPACLPLLPESDVTAEATGWGALGHRQGLADILQTVRLQRYEEAKCSQLYPKHRHLREGYNHTSQMCYGDTREAKDTCEGDSGGPLQTANEFLHCAYTVLGVTSYGRQCGISAGSGMYTRVYHYVPWIESVVWP